MDYQKQDEKEDQLFVDDPPEPLPKGLKGAVWIKKKKPAEHEPQEEEGMFLSPSETVEEKEETLSGEDSMFISEDELKKQHEALLKHVEEIEVARKSLPRKVDLKRVLLFIYVCANLGFLYVSLNSKAIGYIALYMIPLTVLLIDYSMMLGRMNRTIRGEP